MALPPGPALPATVQTALLLQDPVGFFERSRRVFGPVFSAQFVGLPRIAYVATPALADAVLRTDRDIGEAGTARKPFLEPLVGPESVLCLEGEPWMHERRRLGPAFHGRSVAAWRDTIAGIVEDEVATWPTGVEFSLRPRMQRITLEVMMSVVFGLDARASRGTGDGSDERDEADEREAATWRRLRLRQVLRGLVEVASTPALAFVPPRLGAWLEQAPSALRLSHNPLARFVHLKATVDELLLAEIRHQRQPGAAPASDVLTMLAAIPEMPERQIRDELVTLLEAGHETTATGLAWGFERLLRHPSVLAKVREAAEHEDDAYLDAVVKETLRARPVLNDAPRLLTAPLRLGGYDIPPGWYVAPAIPLVHTDPVAYPEPDRFRPERFLEGKLPAGAWIPFGGSRRLCLGIQLALLEMKVVLSEVVRRTDLSPVGRKAERVRLRGVTLVPEHDTRVVARPRVHPENTYAAPRRSSAGSSQ